MDVILSPSSNFRFAENNKRKPFGSRLPKSDIADMIRAGDIKNFLAAIEANLIKIPDDLLDLDSQENSALHIAAKYGRADFVQLLIAGLKVDGEHFCLDPEKPNDVGDTPLDYAKFYGEGGVPGESLRASDSAVLRGIGSVYKNIYSAVRGSFVARNSDPKKRKLSDLMQRMLQTAAITPEKASGREAIVQGVRNLYIDPKILPERKKGYRGVPQSNRDRYDNRARYDGEKFSEASLYLKIRAEYEEFRKKENELRNKQQILRDKFLNDAKNGDLTKDSLEKYLQQGVSLNCTSLIKDGSNNALHMAVIGGQDQVAKMLLECGFVLDQKSQDLLKQNLAKNPNDAGLKKIVECFKEYSVNPIVGSQAAPNKIEQEKVRLQELEERSKELRHQQSLSPMNFAPQTVPKPKKSDVENLLKSQKLGLVSKSEGHYDERPSSSPSVSDYEELSRPSTRGK